MINMEQEQKKQVMCPGCGATLLVNNTTGTSKRIVSCPNCQMPIVVNFGVAIPTPPPPPPSAQQVSASVATPASASVSSPALEEDFPVEQEQQRQRSGRGKAWSIGLLSGFVVVLAGLLVWFLLNKDKPKYVDDDESLWVESDEIMTDAQTSASPKSDDRDWEMSASIAPEVSASVKPEVSASVAPEAVVNTDMHRFIESKISVLKSRKLTENDIRNYDSETMRLLRNSLFATHNYIFKSEDLTAFFSEYSWYSPLYKDVSSTFSQIELYNIGFLKEHE